MDEQEVKRGPGRPRKNVAPKFENKSEEPKTNKYKLRAKPNWEDIDEDVETSVDRLKLPKTFLDKYKDELSFQWVTDSVLGQPEPQHRGQFHKGGWTPVHQDDFDGELDGLFMKKGDTTEINVGGQVLMVRPKKLTEKALRADRRAALEQVQIKEQALRGGDLPVSLDTQHPSALRTNRINKSYERLDIPEK